MNDLLEATVLIREARTAQELDGPKAASLAAEVRGRFPDHPAGYQIGATTARQLGRFDEASSILAEGVVRFPTLSWPVAEQARTAKARGDVDEAVRLASELRDRFPDDPAGYLIGVTSARQLARFPDAVDILAKAVVRFPTLAWPVVEQANTARARGDMDEAIRLASVLRNRFPDDQAGYQIGAIGARQLGRFDEASSIIAESLVRFPAKSWPVAEQANTAKARGDVDEAIRLASVLRDRFPDERTGYQIGAASARQLGRFDEAGVILAESVVRFPTVAWPIAEQADTARARGDVDEAIRLASVLRDRFPDDQAGYQIGAISARQRGRFDEASSIIADSLVRFPSRSWPASEQIKTTRLRANRTAATQLIDMLQTTTGAILEDSERQSSLRGKVVVVLGMHRAGTSLCARIVSKLGVELGAPLLPPNSDNLDGFLEHKLINECHEALLETLDASWETFWFTRPPAERLLKNSAAADAIRERLKHIVARQLEAAGGVWGFKDPRAARFLPLWKEIFEELRVRPIWLLAIRDPRAVAASLLARNGMPSRLGELLWVEHYLEALRHLGPSISGIIDYERWFSSPRSQLQDLAAILGGASPEVIDAASQCIKAELRHNVPEPEDGEFILARRVYSWLSSPQPDLIQLQQRSEAVWRGIEHRGRSVVN